MCFRHIELSDSSKINFTKRLISNQIRTFLLHKSDNFRANDLRFDNNFQKYFQQNLDTQSANKLWHNLIRLDLSRKLDV